LGIPTYAIKRYSLAGSGAGAGGGGGGGSGPGAGPGSGVGSALSYLRDMNVATKEQVICPAASPFVPLSLYK
jgi:hypothetical protein